MDGKGSKPYEHTAITQHYLDNINANAIHLDGKTKRPSRHESVKNATRVQSTDRADNSLEPNILEPRHIQTIPDEYHDGSPHRSQM